MLRIIEYVCGSLWCVMCMLCFFQVKCTVVINRRSDLCYEISEYSFIFGLSRCIDGLFYIQSFIALCI